MATGKFRLFYRNGNADYPCVGVRYQVVASGDAIAAAGQTDAHGETQDFLCNSNGGKYQLQVRDANSGAWAQPDVDEAEPDNDPEIEIGPRANGGIVLKRLRIKPYYRVRFHTHPDNKPLAGAKFTAYALDSHGKEAVAKDLVKSGNVIGATSAQGETGIIFCASNVVFKFELPGAAVKVPTKRLTPLIKGQAIGLYELPFKTVRATTAINPAHQASLAGKTSLPILLSPSDQELIMVPQSDFDEFEEMSGRLEKVMEAAHLAKLDMSRALESQTKEDIEKAEKALGLAEDKVKKELNKNFSKVADLKEVVTLETYNKGKSSSTGAAQMGLRRRYLKTDKYLELKNKRINKTEYKITIKGSKYLGAAKDTKTISPESLDVKALKESFDKIKTSIKSTKEWKGDPKVFNLIDVAGNEYAETLKKSDTYEVEAQAQWLRLVGCAGASAEIDWKKRKAQIQGNLQGKLVLCEGKMTARWAAPSLKGWMMGFAGEDLGAIRFVLQCELYGFAGAKVVASGAVGITLEGGKQVAKAIKKDGTEAFSKLIDPKTKLPRFEADGLYAKSPDDLNGVKAEIDAFAGVEGGITPGGSIQWLPPREKEFVSFAEVSGTVAANAGAGASAQIAIYFRDGRFRVKAAARLCWGLGCKGAVEFTVDVNKLLEFAKWVAYQLANSGFKQLVYFDKIAFRAFSQLLLLCVADGSPTHARLEELSKHIDDEFKDFLEQCDQAQARKAMVNNINISSHWLVHSTPETRGMFLYQITRHGMPSHGRDLPSANLSEGSLYNPEIHFLSDHKQAVNNIMATAQTAAAWRNVFQHMSKDGSKSAKDPGKNEGDVLRFLNDGISLAELPSLFAALNVGGKPKPVTDKKTTGNKYLDKYLEMRGKLPDTFAKGYRIARIDSPEFDLMAACYGEPHIQFGQIQTAGLGEAMKGDPGSSIA